MAYVLRRSGDPIAVDVGEAAPLETLMAEFRAALLDPPADGRGARRTGAARANLGQLTQALSAKLIKPLATHLTQGSRLLISADGALNLIPFAALVDAQGDEDLTAITASVIPQGAVPSAMLGENPLLRSGLALAGANERSSGGGDDGILTAAEVAQLDLLGTQLVVLSACETALGRVDAGEGVHGLRRALVLAGAQSQLVSLWKVDDAGTQQLMRAYYRRLLAGEGRAAALRAVQLDMLADPQRRHPYHWAAFILIGNWTPLAK